MKENGSGDLKDILKIIIPEGRSIKQNKSSPPPPPLEFIFAKMNFNTCLQMFSWRGIFIVALFVDRLLPQENGPLYIHVTNILATQIRNITSKDTASI
jgi:hypothetical protein